MKKILSALLCLLMLFTATACKQTPPEPELTYEEQKALYDGIIAQYTDLLTAKHNGDDLPALNTDGMDEREAAIAAAIHGIVAPIKNAESAERLGYGYRDLDKNGTPELLLLSKYHDIRAIFTILDRQPILLEALGNGLHQIYFAGRNRFFMARKTVGEQTQENINYICHVDGDQMVYDAVYGKVWNLESKECIETFQTVNGSRVSIDDEAFYDLNREYEKILLAGGYDYSQLFTLLRFFLLVQKLEHENLPVADFSNYAAIRQTYRAISTCLESFDTYAWSTGDYAHLFATADDTAFEYYIRLLYSAYHWQDRAGYDEIDLNGDGQDELVLMDENYNIKAIFTQKNGKPVLIDAFARETCWLDDQGLIHVNREDYYELEYSLYEFTKDGDYRLVYSILVDEKGNRYLTKDGKTERMTYEASMELYYDDYCRYSEPFDPNEQTRNASDLTFTPLTQPTEDFARVAAGKTWHKHASLEETTGKDFAWSNIYVTFENVTDTQMDVNFKYEFTFMYPDPEKEHYLASDTTESFLKVTASAENGAFIFEGDGVKGRLEFGQTYLWIVIEESTDQRFPVGFHCYEEPDGTIIE